MLMWNCGRRSLLMAITRNFLDKENLGHFYGRLDGRLDVNGSCLTMFNCNCKASAQTRCKFFVFMFL